MNDRQKTTCSSWWGGFKLEIGIECGTTVISTGTYIILNINKQFGWWYYNKQCWNMRMIQKCLEGLKVMEIDNIYKMILTSWSNGLKSGKCCSILGNVNASTQDMERRGRIYEGGTVLSTTVKEMDLGLTISADMKVSEQCGIAASKGNQILGLIRRNITYKKRANNTSVQNNS